MSSSGSSIRQDGDDVAAVPLRPRPERRKEQQQTEQQEVYDEEDFGGFMSASLPALPVHIFVCSTLNSDSAASERRGGHQRPPPPKVLEGTLVCHSSG